MSRGFVVIRVVKWRDIYPKQRILGDKSINKKDSGLGMGEFSYTKSHSE